MIVGIDLGTTNSLIGYFDGEKPLLIPNALGHKLTPSAVSVDANGEVLTGLAARERLATDPANTATNFKRWMGSDKSFLLRNRKFRAEELSALVLKSLKADAEAALGTIVTEAVITVPAYFNEAQRRATKAAGELAGLKVERLLNEPTAAGLAYGLAERPNHTSFLVFDLGGGTFDVSVLEYFDGIVEVRASAGDTRLGGDDFTKAITALLLKKCPALGEGRDSDLAVEGALWRVSEQIKRDLSDKAEIEHAISAGNTRVEIKFTREEFEQVSKELVDRLRRPIERAMSDAQIQVAELAEIVLVGGATRMPAIRQLATRLFQRLPLRTIDPDETVARGAAVQAALKSGNKALDEVVLTDVMPYSLGVITTEKIHGRLITNRFSPVIERNTPIPVSRSSTFGTVQDNQREILLDIRQGESPVGSENLPLGELHLNVLPMPAGQVMIDVRFSYDANGLLVVDAKNHQTGIAVSTVINQSSNVMSEEELRKALQKLDALKIHPREQQENLYLVERAKRLYADLLGSDRLTAQGLLNAFEAAMDTQVERIIRDARVVIKAGLDELDKGFVL